MLEALAAFLVQQEKVVLVLPSIFVTQIATVLYIDLVASFLVFPFALFYWDFTVSQFIVLYVLYVISDLLVDNLYSIISKRGKVLWEIVVPVVLWSLWIERNNNIFEKSNESLDDIWDRIKYRDAYWLFGHTSFKDTSVSDLIRDLSFSL